MVYFIKCENYVKVGYTANMKQRFKKYVTENPFPLKVLGIINGGYDVEKKIHKQLETWWHRGEWFTYNIVVRDLIKQIMKENKDNEEVKPKKRRRRVKRRVKATSLKG